MRRLNVRCSSSRVRTARVSACSQISPATLWFSGHPHRPPGQPYAGRSPYVALQHARAADLPSCRSPRCSFRMEHSSVKNDDAKACCAVNLCLQRNGTRALVSARMDMLAASLKSIQEARISSKCPVCAWALAGTASHIRGLFSGFFRPPQLQQCHSRGGPATSALPTIRRNCAINRLRHSPPPPLANMALTCRDDGHEELTAA